MVKTSFQLYNSIMNDEQLVQVSRVFKVTWQQAYRYIFPKDQLLNLDEREWQRSLLQPGRHNIIAVSDDNQVLGVASYGRARERTANRGELMAIYVLPKYQGQGLGDVLLTKAEQGLHLLNYSHYILWVLSDNHQAMKFYYNHGWKTNGVIKEKIILGEKVSLVQLRK
ncbi:GNAT family N-acetyltransferase [Lactobacillus sp. 0.1XD8-4]|uniref:GNAT family N-acetyltransferase n=1 Tax=uncultured Limosilactobacillus sp. TaxID=2837629 RepID=UPI00129E1496|nr:GNAT family N-acetyltransferase [uncultured Limosilactobacillus sp.]MRN07203.1 GNAT family N-acetyltransferase [Lactobacillus sp. 0.1XD8-4]